MNLTAMHARSRQQGVELSAQNRAELLAERKRLGLKRSDVGRMIGCHGEHVGQLERGEASPRWDVLHRWVKVLGFEATVGLNKRID